MGDYGETHAPVFYFTSIQVMLATVAVQDLELHKMDIVTAFLCRNQRNTWRYRQASRIRPVRTLCANCSRHWRVLNKLRGSGTPGFFSIKELDFVSSPNDPCLYVKHAAKALMLIAMYVVDLLSL